MLVDADGEPFMARYHPAAELAPRDVVARAIDAERARRPRRLPRRPRGGRRRTSRRSFPPCSPPAWPPASTRASQPIPVAPAAHYHMGGVATDVGGRTSLPGLFAAGECASTGVHGANRLASNSLLEAAVFGAPGRARGRARPPGSPARPLAASQPRRPARRGRWPPCAAP